MNDNQEHFRDYVSQQYIAGKVFDGASLDEIAKGMADPVEEMKFLNKLVDEPNPAAGKDKSGFGAYLLIGGIIIAAVISLLLRLVF